MRSRNQSKHIAFLDHAERRTERKKSAHFLIRQVLTAKVSWLIWRNFVLGPGHGAATASPSSSTVIQIDPRDEPSASAQRGVD
jgi:hypothetical protein